MILTKQEANARNFKNIFYDITLEIDSDNCEEFKGFIEINFDNYLNLNETFLDAKVTILNCFVNEKEIKNLKKYILENKLIIKNLKNGFNKLFIEYIGNFSNQIEAYGLINYKNQSETLIYSNLEPYGANKIFPCFDQPNCKSEFVLKVITNKEFNVISNSKLIEKKIENQKYIFIFSKTEKMSTYIFALILGDLEYIEDEYNNISLRIFFRKSLKHKINPKQLSWILNVTKKSFFELEKLFSIKYSFQKYDQILVPSLGNQTAGMENIGAVTFVENYLIKSKITKQEKIEQAILIIHEMIHMWFGNLVTLNWWDDLWLNESFTDFFSYFVLKKIYKEFDIELEDVILSINYRKFAGYKLDNTANRHAIVQPVNDTNCKENFDAISYCKGHSILDELLYRLGEENFLLKIREYLLKFSYQNGSLEDFIKIFEQDNVLNTKWLKTGLFTSGCNIIKKRSKGYVINSFTCSTILERPEITCLIFNQFEHFWIKTIVDKNIINLHSISTNSKTLYLFNADNQHYLIQDYTPKELNLIFQYLDKIDIVTFCNIIKNIIIIKGQTMERKFNNVIYNLIREKVFNINYIPFGVRSIKIIGILNLNIFIIEILKQIEKCNSITSYSYQNIKNILIIIFCCINNNAITIDNSKYIIENNKNININNNFEIHILHSYFIEFSSNNNTFLDLYLFLNDLYNSSLDLNNIIHYENFNFQNKFSNNNKWKILYKLTNFENIKQLTYEVTNICNNVYNIQLLKKIKLSNKYLNNKKRILEICENLHLIENDFDSKTKLDTIKFFFTEQTKSKQKAKIRILNKIFTNKLKNINDLTKKIIANYWNIIKPNKNLIKHYFYKLNTNLKYFNENNIFYFTNELFPPITKKNYIFIRIELESILKKTTKYFIKKIFNNKLLLTYDNFILNDY